MDFFDQQIRAHRKTRHLVVYFSLSVLFLVTAAAVVITFLVLTFQEAYTIRSGLYLNLFAGLINHFLDVFMQPARFMKWIWHPWLFLVTAVATSIVITLAASYKIHQLSAGGSAVARLLGGRELDPEPSDLDEKRFKNVVEEMAIASGMPVPEMYVLDGERGINAFAAGHTTSDAAIAVTRGCLKTLTRDELQGVVAHEFSHVLNGDTRLNMRLMGLAHGLLFPYLAGAVLIGAREDYGSSVLDEDAPGSRLPFAFIGIALQVFGFGAVPFVRFLKSAICREREWLADASAVQFTRNPGGLGGGLRKIGGLVLHGRLITPHAESASHLYFVNYVGSSLVPFLDTHPPLPQRILAVDPSFDGSFPRVAPLPISAVERERNLADAIVTMLHTGGRNNVALEEAVAPTIRRMQDALLLREAIPREALRAAQIPLGAVATVYGLLLDADDTARAHQLETLAQTTETDLCRDAASRMDLLRPLDARGRVVLVDLALPALRRLTLEQYGPFMNAVNQLIESDQTITLFEFTVKTILTRHLTPRFVAVPPPALTYRSLAELSTECSVVLSALARMGHEQPSEIEAAFQRGADELELGRIRLTISEPDECNLPQVAAALEKLAHLQPIPRKNLVFGCGYCVAADHRLERHEVLLMRIIADSLDCPVPPFVESLPSD